MTAVTNDPVVHNLWTTVARRVRHGMLAAIEWYQAQREHLLSPCRFYPSCSNYAHEAIHRHGAWRGGWMSVRRLLRCRPFGPSGYDPVPESGTPLAPCCAHHKEMTNV